MMEIGNTFKFHNPKNSHNPIFEPQIFLKKREEVVLLIYKILDQTFMF